jgi:TIR domain
MPSIRRPTEHRYDVFIAHAAPDTELAERLYALLTPHCTVFLDSKSLEPGDIWPAQLHDALNASATIAILITPNSNAAYYETEEIATAISLARHAQTRVIPIYVGTPTARPQPPYGLRIIHSITTTEDGLAVAADQIIHATRVADTPIHASVAFDTVSHLDMGCSRVADLLVHGAASRYFAEPYKDLASDYLWPISVFDRTRMDRFVGRQWLFTEINTFIDSHDRGYVVLEGAAGVGKTAAIARLVTEQSHIHHFVELTPGPEGVAAAIKSIATQLIVAWDLGSAVVNELYPLAAVQHDFLQRLLFLCAERRKAVDVDEPIVIAVDGLDESLGSARNALMLPQILPENVFVIAAHRPTAVLLHTFTARRVITLEESSPENIADVRLYLTAAADRGAFNRAAASSSLEPDDVIDTLVDRCGGIWIYLHYVVTDIESGHTAVTDATKIPAGLWQYYAQFCERWRHHDTWPTILRLLADMAVLREPITLDLLCSIAGCALTDSIRDILTNSWRPFLAVVGSGAAESYRLYHRSLRDFIEGHVDTNQLTASQRTMVSELAAATRTSHSRIAEYYLATWGGFDTNLVALQQPFAPSNDIGYGLRHLVWHLASAGRANDLQRLFDLEWQLDRNDEPVNVWHTVHEQFGDPTGFLSDLAIAWDMADKQCSAAFGASERHCTVMSLSFQCALLTTTVRTLAGNVGRLLLRALVKQRLWSSRHALTYARQIVEPEARTRALLALYSVVSPDEQREVLADVLASYQQHLVSHGALGRIAGDLPQDLPHPFLVRFIEITDAKVSGWLGDDSVFVALTRTLSANLCEDKLLPIARKLRHGYDRIPALSAIAAALPAGAAREFLTAEVVTDAHNVPADELMGAPIGMLQCLRGAARIAAIDFLLQRIRAGDDAERMVRDFAKLLPHLEMPERERVALEALDVILDVPANDAFHGLNTCYAMSEIVPFVPATALATVERAAAGMWAPYKCEVQSALAIRTGVSLGAPHVFARVAEIETGWVRAKTIASLASTAHDSGSIGVWFELALAIDRADARVTAIDGLSQYLSPQQLRAAVRSAQRSDDENVRAQAKGEILVQLARLGHAEEVFRDVTYLGIDATPYVRQIATAMDDASLQRAISRASFATRTRRASLVIEALRRAGERASPDLIRRAVRTVSEVRAKDDRLQLYAELAANLPRPRNATAIKRALRLAKKLGTSHYWQWSASSALQKLVKSMDEPQVRYSIGIASSFEANGARVPLLSALGDALAERWLADIIRVTDSSAPSDSAIRPVIAHDHEFVGLSTLLRWIVSSLPKTWVAGVAARARAAVYREPIRTARATIMEYLKAPLLMETQFARLFRNHAREAMLYLALVVGGEALSKRSKFYLVRDCLESACQIGDPKIRAYVLTRLVPHLGHQDRYETIQSVAACSLSMRKPEQRMSILREIAPYLHIYFRRRIMVNDGHGPDANAEPVEASYVLDVLSQFGSVDALLTVLRTLGRHEAEALSREGLRRALQLTHRELRVEAVAALLAQLEPSLRARMLSRHLRELWTQKGPHWVADAIATLSPRHRVSILEKCIPLCTRNFGWHHEGWSAIAPYLTDEMLYDAFVQQSKHIDKHDVLRDLAALADRLVTLPALRLHECWVTVLSARATGDRDALLRSFQPIARMLAALGDVTTLRTTMRHIERSGRWWP